ncbi:MAG: hypothetical protein HC871_11845 [Rhizobiales bacterium]|nr:hypothetical protein [Hyphomicrobiales bacterium]
MEMAMATTESPGRRRGAGRWLFALGILLLALALLALFYELAVAAESGGYRAIAAGELWFRLHPYSLNLAQAITQRYILPSLWDPLMVGVLQWPAWSILGAPGAILAVLFYPRKRRDG